MKRHFATFALACFVSSGLAHGAAAKAELPQWDDNDRKAVTAHKLAVGTDVLPEQGSSKIPATDLAPPAAADIVGDPSRAHDVPDRFLDAYFSARPKTYLVDPQGLLDARAGKEREDFLAYHSDDSQIDLYIYLFGRDQEIPGSARGEEVPERIFSDGKPAVIIYYFLGAPERTTIAVSPTLTDSVSAADQHRAMTTALAEALEKHDPVTQLDSFSVQMSVRLYWMEKSAGLVQSETASAYVPFKKAKADDDGDESSHEALKEKLLGLARRWWVPAAFGSASLMVAAAGWFAYRFRRRYRFPDFEIPPRLGGDHAAGIGAVISFGSTTQSPSSQRRDLKDCLGI